ncbi:hypothetical protein IQ255_15760 [Pleurocapsales cyanobacterium LEGE 10410]|nr:hypothetical protein [Pleurocapsales cyanobacterium LEGE 10410]
MQLKRKFWKKSVKARCSKHILYFEFRRSIIEMTENANRGRVFHKTRQLTKPDAETGKAIAELYNSEMDKQLTCSITLG